MYDNDLFPYVCRFIISGALGVDSSTPPQQAVATGLRGETTKSTAAAVPESIGSITSNTTVAAARGGGRGGRGGGGRGVRRRRPGEGRGRGANRGTKPAFLRSRDFVLKIRGMSRWNWRGVLQELEAAEEIEARFGEVSQRCLDV